MITTKLTFDPTGWLEINYLQVGDEATLTLQSTSYHPTQLELIHADCATHGVTIEGADAEAVAEWVDSYVPPHPAPVPIPKNITAFQAKAALLHANLLDAVEAMMAAPETPRIVKLAWVETLHFERQSPTVAAMASAIGLTDADVDALFIAGSLVTA